MKRTIYISLLGFLFIAGSAPGAGTFGKSLNGIDVSLSSGEVHGTYATDQWYKIYSSNSSLWVSNFGTYGGETYYPDLGFRFNTGSYSDPEHYGSTGRCLTDSPTQIDYDPEMVTIAYMPGPVTLPSASTITLSYYAKWDIEVDRDCCEVVYVTSSSGVPDVGDWNNLSATSSVARSTIPVQMYAGQWIYEDEQSTWTLENVNLSSLAGQTVRIGFLFRSDQSNITPYDGIYIDELEIVADSSPVYSTGFDTVLENWSYHTYDGNGEGWGLSTSLPLEVMLIKNGQLCVGNSTAYVANRGDWSALNNGNFNTETLYTYFSNSDTVPANQPEMAVQLYSYIFDDYAINDYYVTNISGTSYSNVYIGMGNNAAIEFGSDEQGNEYFMYDPGDDVGLWNNAMDTDDGPMLGIIYLSDGTTASYNVGSNLDPADDATVFTNMSNGQHDYSGSWSPTQNRYISIFGVGPFTMGPGAQRRFAVGFVGGDGETDLSTNIGRCTTTYGNLEPHNGIRSASLGEIKAMYR